MWRHGVQIDADEEGMKVRNYFLGLLKQSEEETAGGVKETHSSEKVYTYITRFFMRIRCKLLLLSEEKWSVTCDILVKNTLSSKNIKSKVFNVSK